MSTSVGPVKLRPPLSDTLAEFCSRHHVDKSHAVRIALSRLDINDPPTDDERDLRGVVGNPRASEAARRRWAKEFGRED